MIPLVYSESNPMQENLLNLNKAQELAVKTFDTPLLVLAGAGSGKTRVITAKIAEIIQTGRALPWQILAVTFTNKAANEMLERVKGFVSAGEVHSLNIGTFHSICVRMLRSCATLVGFGNNFLIADTADQKKILKDIMQEMGLDVKAFPVGTILSFVSRVKEKFISPQELTGNFMQFPNIYREVRLDKIYAEYQFRLKMQNMMDFDDLLFFATKLLVENPNILEQYRERFKYILIDEYQDINSLQYKWFRLLCGQNQNVCVVGDDDQSIYGWRGADVSIILSFAKDFKNAHVIKLEQNYRSTGNIIKLAENIISNNRNRHGKTLFTESAEGAKVKITTYMDSKIEAKEIVHKIQEVAKVQGRKYGEFAILVRATSQTRILEEAFIALGIPYKIIGGLKFYERREVKDVLSYIKVVNGMADDLAMERVIKTPKRGIGEASVDKIIDFARERGISLMQACFDLTGDIFTEGKVVGVKALNILTALMSNIKKWKERALEDGMKGFVSTIVGVIEEIRYIEFLKEEDEDQIDARAANINELLNSMQGFESVDAFLEHISLVANVDDVDFDAENAVKMLTMHSAKGLEFKVVFLPGWEEGLFPSSKTVEQGGEVGIEEERRLAYVGITRAREELFISSTKMRMIYGGFNPTRESMFITEIRSMPCVDFRDKTIGFSGRSNEGGGFGGGGFKQGSFNEEIKRKFEGIAKGGFVMHKLFGIGKVLNKVSGNLFEIQFEDGEKKTIRADFLTPAPKEIE